MDYSKYPPEDAARLRRQDERIQLLREQRELGQQMLKEMIERDTYEASLAAVSQDTPNTDTQVRPTARTSTTLAAPGSRDLHTSSSTQPSDADEGNVFVASSSRKSPQKRRRVSRSRSLSSNDTDYRPQRQKLRGNPASKQYPLFSDDKKYNCIMNTSGGVVEIACNFCGGNYFRSRGDWKYLRGVQGVESHINMSHPDEHKRIRFTGQPYFKWVAEHCVVQVLTEEQKEDVRHGRYKVRPVKVRTLSDEANDAEPEAA